VRAMRIQTRIIGAAVLVIVSATILFVVYLLRTERANSRGRLRAVMEENETLLMVVTAGPLYDGNVEQLNIALDSFFANPDMVRIVLTELEGDIRISRTREPAAQMGEMITSRVPIKRGIDDLGEIEVTYSTARLEKSLRASRNRVLIFSGALVLGLSSIIYLAVRGVTRPIGRLTVAARDMADGHLEREIDSRGAEELQILGQSFIRLRDTIREKMADLAARNEQLRISEDRLRTVVENTPVVLFALDQSGRFTLSEGKGLAVLGLQPGQIVGQSAYAIYRDSPAALDGVRRALAGEQFSLVAELAGLTLEIWFSPVRNAAGELLGTIGVGTDITERKRAEAELQTAHALLQGVINATQDLIFVKDTSLTFLACNRAFADCLGRSEEQVVGHRDEEWFEDRQILESFRDSDRKVLAEGRQQYIEEWVTYPDGKRVPLETLKSPFYDDDGKLLGLIGISRDISARQRADQARRESEERLRAAIGVSQIGIFDHDQRSDTVYWSPQQRQIYGWGPNEPVSLQDFLDLVHPEDRESVIASVRRAHDPAGDGIWDVEHRIIRRDGSTRWLKQRAQTFFEGTGPARKPVRTIGAVLDITERMTTEEEQQKLVSIIDSSPDFIGIADLGGQLLYVNSSGRNLVGLDNSEEVRSKHISDFLREQDVVLLETEQLPLIHRSGGWTGELALRNFKTGVTIPVEMNAFMIRERSSGRPIALANISRDITERKRVQAEREGLIGELELRNAELERFTYTVSHDLRSPLITMRGFLGYLEKDALTGNLERIKADIGRIIDATDKMDRLLRELLELSRIGRVMNPPEQVPFEQIAQEAAGLVAGRLQERGIRMVIATGMPVVHGDRVRLVEVVQNLLDNAAKFIGSQAAPLIQIGVRGEERNGKPVFFVRDNGIGIDPPYQEKIFGLFEKLDPKSEGTGIGLALVKRIVEVHGGMIWLESEGLGGGSTFCFTLPRKQSAVSNGG
jgi:PAS domain S-box-containing protein